ncbi:MAG: hypothetical protein AB1730_07185 [Myxococcota bacterium]|jgi:hypothetical protein
MKRLTWVAALVLAVSVSATAATRKKKKPAPPPPPPVAPMPKVKEHLSDAVQQLLAASDKVQVWRVSDTGGLRPDPTRAIGSDFQREQAGKELSADEVKALKGLLYDDKSYRFEQDVSRCGFVPHLSFHVEGADANVSTLEALVSFKCNQVLFFIGKPGGRWLPGGTFDIKPVRQKLIAVAQAALPADAETQKLK